MCMYVREEMETVLLRDSDSGCVCVCAGDRMHLLAQNSVRLAP